MASIRVVSKDFDTKQEAEDWKTAYYNNYNPFGYGTSLAVQFLPTSRKYVVTGYRFSSCD